MTTLQNGNTELVRGLPPTLDAPDGTVLRLVEDSLWADVGAIGIVDRTLGHHPEDLPVTWLFGHTHDGVSQQNGGYEPESFVVHEFQPYDRVRVSGTASHSQEQGWTGTIIEFAPANGDDVLVLMDGEAEVEPYPAERSLSYNFENLDRLRGEDEEPEFYVGQRVRVEGWSSFWDGPATVTRIDDDGLVIVESDSEEITYAGGFSEGYIRTLQQASDEALASLRGALSPKPSTPPWTEIGYVTDFEPEELEDDEYDDESESTFEAGDIVVLTKDAPLSGSPFAGTRYRVLGTSTFGNLWLEDGAYDQRPDEFVGNFNWPETDARHFDPETDFRVGDYVRSDYYARRFEAPDTAGVITGFRGKFVVVDWLVGDDVLVDAEPLTADRWACELVTTEEFQAIEEPYLLAMEFVDQMGSLTKALEFYSIPVSVTVGDEAEPSDFDFEAGQEIGSSDVLDELPVGTVLYDPDDAESPWVKTYGDFVRANRYMNSDDYTAPVAYFSADEVEERCDDDLSAVMIGYVPQV